MNPQRVGTPYEELCAAWRASLTRGPLRVPTIALGATPGAARGRADNPGLCRPADLGGIGAVSAFPGRPRRSVGSSSTQKGIAIADSTRTVHCRMRDRAESGLRRIPTMGGIHGPPVSLMLDRNRPWAMSRTCFLGSASRGGDVNHEFPKPTGGGRCGDSWLQRWNHPSGGIVRSDGWPYVHGEAVHVKAFYPGPPAWRAAVCLAEGLLACSAFAKFAPA
jgi:hypothetical protein